MSGHTYTHTYIHTHTHTHTHTYTHDNYYNPRCAHAHRGLMIKIFILPPPPLLLYTIYYIPLQRRKIIFNRARGAPISRARCACV